VVGLSQRLDLVACTISGKKLRSGVDVPVLMDQRRPETVLLAPYQLVPSLRDFVAGLAAK
jgi:hypothetical protein